MPRKFQPGQWVIYRATKHSTKPGPRAQNIEPAPGGESYAYQVDKYWCVQELLPENQICLRTRTGKIRTISIDDPQLRHARWWEKLLLSSRFPTDDSTADDRPA